MHHSARQAASLRTAHCCPWTIARRRIQTTARQDGPAGSNGSGSAGGSGSTTTAATTAGSSSSSSSTTSSSASTSHAKRAQERRFLLTQIASVGGLGVGLGYYLYNTMTRRSSTSQRQQQRDHALDASPFQMEGRGGSPDDPDQVFTIPVRDGATGLVRRQELALISAKRADDRLRAREESTLVNREGNCIWRYDTASLNSNDPMEDAHVETILQKDPGAGTGAGVAKVASPGDICFFGIFDGHSGYRTSQLLAKALVPRVALELDHFYHARGRYAEAAGSKALAGHLDDVQAVKDVLKMAYVAMDHEIVDLPIRKLFGIEQNTYPGWMPSKETSMLYPLQIIRSFKGPDKMSAAEELRPALSGSCALLAYLDAAQKDFYVAVAGDSRAVAGVRDPQTGEWNAVVLTEDQTGRSPSEKMRIQSEHPADEAETVVQRGRVLGHLEPTRAFGDSRYKWSAELMKKVGDELGWRTKPPPSDLKSPPYVTARPEVTHVKVDGSQSALADGEIQFVVMATDGLWDRLSNADVVGLVGQWLDGAREERPADKVQAKVLAEGFGAGFDGKSGSVQGAAEATGASAAVAGGMKKESRDRRVFTFHDSNIATHLIRNSLGGAQGLKTRAFLSIPAPLARRYYDDTTVTVILFGDGKGREGIGGGRVRARGVSRWPPASRGNEIAEGKDVEAKL